LDILNPLFAVIAAIGFSLVFKVQKNHIPFVGILAFCGFLTRELLLEAGIGIEISVLAGALCVGIMGDLAAQKTKMLPQMLKVPAGIPMIPGAFVFEAIKNIIVFVSAPKPDMQKLELFFYYGGKSVFILAALAFGLTASSIIFKKRG
jgi:uncharacterized membrane protein YjjB (DUF3815 family)